MATALLNVVILMVSCVVDMNNYQLGCKETTANTIVCATGNFTTDLDNNIQLPVKKQMITDILLENCKMDIISQEIFTYFRNLQYLNASNSKIKNVSFKKQSRLKKIDLSHNLITELPSQGFTGLYRIIEIDLSYNAITTIHENAFEGTPKLRKINLSHNPIKILDIKVTINLVNIDMSFNKIEHLHNDDHNTNYTNLSNIKSANEANPTFLVSFSFYMFVLPFVHTLYYE